MLPIVAVQILNCKEDFAGVVSGYSRTERERERVTIKGVKEIEEASSSKEKL